MRDEKTGLFKSVSKASSNLKPVKKGGRPKGKKDSKPRNLKHKRFKNREKIAAPVSELAASTAVPAPIIAPSPAPAAQLENIATVSDSKIFNHGSPPEPKPGPGGDKNFDPGQNVNGGPGPAPAPGPGEEIPPLNEPAAESEKPSPSTPDKALDPQMLAELVWGMELNLMAAIFGKPMLPRKYVNPAMAQPDLSAGELPYDEGEMVRSAWVDYLSSLGLIVLSPLKALYLAHVVYLIPRMIVLVQGVRGWFRKKTPQNNGGESEAKKSNQKPEPRKKSPEQETAKPESSEQSESAPKKGTPFDETVLEGMR